MPMSRSSISAKSFAVAFAIVAAVISTAKLHAFEVTSKAQVQESWTGFDGDFNPMWSGVTKKVNWTLPKPASYASYGSLVVSIAGWRGGYDFDYKPIELLWSKRGIAYSAEAAIDQVVASVADDPGMASAGPWSSANARYGEVTDLKGTLLANGSTIGTQWSDIKEASLTAEGRVSASAIMESSMLNRGRARASSKSQLEAAYRINEPANFSLTGMLAGGGDLSLDFELVDDAGNAVYKLSPTVSEVGGAWKFDLQGTLDAGSYTLSVSANAAARMGGYQSSGLGGEGEYEINFSATPVTPFVPREKPQWQKDLFKLQAGDFGLLWPTEVTPPVNTEASLFVPEPQTCAMLLLGMTLLGLRRTSYPLIKR
jgi:hypothetical protein